MSKLEKETDRYVVPALRRGLAVLQCFRSDRRLLGVPEISRELGLPRATTFRLVYTLRGEGYLMQAPGSNLYKLGHRVLSLGFEYLHSDEIVEIARPFLESLRDRHNASAHLGIRDGMFAVYICRAPSRQRLSSNVTVGTRLPAHAASVGRALLLDLTDRELTDLYDGFSFEVFSDQTPADLEALRAQLRKERDLGYVAYRSAFALGIASAAAPVRDRSGEIVAAINVSDYESLPCMAELSGKLKDDVVRAALDISMLLGYQPSAKGSVSKPQCSGASPR